MTLSIVIPAYNEEKYLPRTLSALDAALADTENYELVLVDNGSTDRTRAIAEEFGTKIVDESVHNIGHVRNTGAAVVNLDVIVFLDADTIVRPGVFQKISAAMSDERCVGGSVAVEYLCEFRRARGCAGS